MVKNIYFIYSCYNRKRLSYLEESGQSIKGLGETPLPRLDFSIGD